MADRNRSSRYDDGDIEEAEVGTVVPPVYDVPSSEWKTFPSALSDLLSGVLDGLEVSSAEAERRRWMPYHEYLKTEEWAILRRIVRRRAQNRCERCGTRRQQLNVHHLTYANRGAEDPRDLVCLCRDCHRKEHGITSDHPYTEDD